MPKYSAPGVYVEEVPGHSRPIEAIRTSIAAFFGCIPNASAPLRRPVPVDSYAKFQSAFCVAKTGKSSTLEDAVAGFFQNGGSLLYVINLGVDAEVIDPSDLTLISTLEAISLIAAPGFTDPSSHAALIAACEQNPRMFAVLDLPDTGADINKLATLAADGGVRPRNSPFGCAAAYAPWLRIRDLKSRVVTECPPSGHICGIYARTDASRGVHKAPANTTINGGVGLTENYSDADQAILSPAGINAIRIFPDGIKIWGARTLSEPSGDWRYVPVRRLSTMIEYSLKDGLSWVKFDPNDAILWKSIKRDVSGFLHSLWRNGAIAGAREEEAFFVRCDAQTTTQSDIDMGRINLHVGFAPLRPAEFIVINITLESAM